MQMQTQMQAKKTKPFMIIASKDREKNKITYKNILKKKKKKKKKKNNIIIIVIIVDL